MRRDWLSFLYALAVCFLAGPAVAGEDNAFCVALKSLTVQSDGGGLDAVQGPKLGLAWDDHGGDDETRYAATRTLPGAQACGVDKDHADGEDLITTYRCWFPAAPDKAEAVARLGRQIAECLGVQAGAAQLTRRGGVVAAFDLDRPDYVIDVSADAAPAVVFQISGK